MGSVVTIGNFDGVHRGHQELLKQTAKIAQAKGLESIAITFEPHPIIVHYPESALPLITGYDERRQQIENTGIDRVVVLPYTKEFAAQSDAEFVKNYLVDKFDAKVIVLGSDAKFGRGNSGDLTSLRSLAPQFGFEVIEVAGIGPENGPRWSSSAARTAILSGEMQQATQILGREHSISGIVVHGDHRGRTLGFPTANLGEIQGLIPPDGVYAGHVSWSVEQPSGAEWPSKPPTDGFLLPAAISIGTNPTFTDGPERRVEAYVIDQTDLDLYGLTVKLTFTQKIRDTLKFSSVADLITQMHDDVAQVRQLTALAMIRTNCADVEPSRFLGRN